jgi:enterochelin esterase-like enzyme
VLLLVATVVVVVLMLRFARRLGSILLAVVLVAVLVLANLAAAANAYYDRYPTVQALLSGRATEKAPPAAQAPAAGQVVPVEIPGERSNFAARQALVHLPPAWFAEPRPQLPVIVLLHDTGGSPQEWIDDGEAARTADAWAAAHGGVAPILVLPDVSGVDGRARGCVDSPLGHVETYLTADVPALVQRQFSTLPPGPAWAVAGQSAGGACAIMLALRHPDLFGTFGDFGGLAGPRLGDKNTDVTVTVTELFEGSAQRFGEHEPAQLLAGARFPDLGGWFQVGTEDTEPVTAMATLVPLARSAGIDTCLVVRPGQAGGPPMWSAAFADALPWMAARLGQVPETAEMTRDCGLVPAL